jgi:uncharacterized protein (DUF1501 family)
MSERSPSSAVNRRDLFRLAAAGFATTGTAPWFQALARRAPESPAAGAKPKSCILLWMIGGPPQTLTFDPKGHSAIKATGTAAAGVRISENFPKLASQMKDVTLLRGMQTGDSNHGTARYLMHTGFRKGQNGVAHPVMGSIVAHELAKDSSELPPFVSVGSPRFGGYGPGHFGPKFSPIRVDDPTGGLKDLAPVDSRSEFDDRAALVEELNADFLTNRPSRTALAHEVTFAAAARLMHSPKAKAFDVSTEPQGVRDAYGRGQFGQSVLLARRLVESGVRFVEVRQDGWDVHKDTVNRTKKLSDELDAPFATLLSELKSRGRLDDTLVICMGEFGRNPANGSSHFSRAWTAVLAGGGLKNGRAIGDTGNNGGTVESHPVSPGDFIATVCKALGVDYKQDWETSTGRPVPRVAKGSNPVPELF